MNIKNSMKKFNFKKINAFATQKSEGDPALGYCLINNGK
jgi:hypothetical protein